MAVDAIGTGALRWHLPKATSTNLDVLEGVTMHHLLTQYDRRHFCIILIVIQVFEHRAFKPKVWGRSIAWLLTIDQQHCSIYFRCF